MKKNNRVLKTLCTSLLYLSIFTVYASGQNINTKISINHKEATLVEIFSDIAQKSVFKFTYSEFVLANKNKYNAAYTNQSIKKILNSLSARADFGYTVSGEYIIIRKIEKIPPKKVVQNPVIHGKVTDQNNQPLFGVNIIEQGTSNGTITDENGNFILKTTKSTGVIEFSFIGFATVEKTFSGDTQVIDVVMKEEYGELSEVVLSVIRKVNQPVQHSREAQVVQEIKMSNAIVSGISSEQIGKLADRDAAEVAQRIAGVTVTDEQFLVVRGMNQRYNATYLDGNLAPSTEQYSRAFALNLIPSRIIDKIMVYKSPQPDLFGDFAGGIVKVDIKDALAVKHLDVGVRLGYLPESTFQEMISYEGGNTDWLGFDDGTRALPGAVPGFGNFQKADLSPEQYINAFNPELTYGTITAPLDVQLTINYYDGFNISDKTKLYNVTAFAFTNETRYNNIYRQQGNTLNMFDSRYNNSLTFENRSIETGQLNLMQNFTLKLDDDNQFYFKNFILQKGQKTTQVRISRPNNGQELSEYTKSHVLGYNSRLLYTGNLGGNHISNSKKQVISWNLGYTNTKYELPDQRVINFKSSSKYIDENYASTNWVAAVRTDNTASRRQGIISRQFLDSREKLYNGSLDYTYSFSPKLDIKVGTFNFWKEREVFRRIYVVHDALFTSLDDFANGAYLPGRDEYVNTELVWFREQDIANVWSTDYFRSDRTGLALYDFTLPSDAYIASEQYHANYIKFMVRPWGKKLEFSGGARLEYDRQKVSAAEKTNVFNVPLLVDREETTLLPSLTVTYRPDNKWVFRANYGKTVNRPEFREITPFKDFDYINNEEIIGNAQLEMATIDNIDARIEFYPEKNKGEFFSIGGFYKYLDKPIERINFSSLNSGTENPFTEITYRNADEARVYGIEAEIRKSMAFIPGKVFEDISFVANAAWIYSETRKDSIRDDEREQVRYARTFKRPLQGQAPYVINAGFFYDNETSGTSASVSWNVSGTSIYAAGVFTENEYLFSSTRGSILQLPRHLLDVALKQKIGERMQVKFSVQNLLNAEIKWAEDNDFNNEYNPEKIEQTAAGTNRYVGDNIYQKYNPGRQFLLSLVYSF